MRLPADDRPRPYRSTALAAGVTAAVAVSAIVAAGLSGAIAYALEAFARTGVCTPRAWDVVESHLGFHVGLPLVGGAVAGGATLIGLARSRRAGKPRHGLAVIGLLLGAISGPVFIELAIRAEYGRGGLRGPGWAEAGTLLLASFAFLVALAAARDVARPTADVADRVAWLTGCATMPVAVAGILAGGAALVTVPALALGIALALAGGMRGLDRARKLVGAYGADQGLSVATRSIGARDETLVPLVPFEGEVAELLAPGPSAGDPYRGGGGPEPLALVPASRDVAAAIERGARRRVAVAIAATLVVSAVVSRALDRVPAHSVAGRPDAPAVEVVATPGARVAGLALDSAHLYFTTDDGRLTKQPRDGGRPVDLARELARPGEVAVDGGFVYFTVSHGVARVPTGGGAVERVTSVDTEWVNRLVVDETNVYFLARVFPTQAPKNGGDAIASPIRYETWDVGVDGTSVYYATIGGTLYAVPKGGGVRVPLSSLGTSSIAAVGPTHVVFSTLAKDGRTHGTLARVAKGGGTREILAEGLAPIGQIAVRGESIVLVESGYGTASCWHGSVDLVDASGGLRALATMRPTVYPGALALDPSGDDVYFATWDADARRATVQRVSAAR